MEIKENTIYNCDCIKLLEEMEKSNFKVDKVLTSPPYNIIRPNFMDRGYDVYKDGMSKPNNVSSNKLTRICEFVYIFCRRNESKTFLANKKIVKLRESGQNIYENIFNMIKAKNNDENCDLNKATFSTDLCIKLMNIYCGSNEIVLDTFMGTGTTAIACYRKGLKYIGSELSEKQCEWSEKRINKEKQQISFFD